jgi:3'-phosphoadenosine 5'-phosphosulfate sulfotransferase (PAPS reductase)/FAD synthetase
MKSEEKASLVLRPPLRDRICVSFSGGKTSAFLRYKLGEVLGSQKEIVTIFANTGCEHEKTLEFVQRCSDHYGWNVVWVEAVVNPGHGNGTTHRVVNFDSADRSGRPFEDMIKEYGLPGPGFLHCTRELKDRPIASYLRSLGWQPRARSIAIGIRGDEIDRIAPTNFQKGFVYPLSDWGVTKTDVLDFWAKQPFTLDLPEHYGNCTWCWKKSPRKLMTLAKTDPSVFDFPARMESLYRSAGAGDQERFFFRGRKLTGDILRDAKTLSFDAFVDGQFPDWNVDLDVGGSCGESCEIGADLYMEEEEDEPFSLQYS